MGPVLGNVVAVVLPWVEALAGVFLLAGIWKRESSLLIALMLVTFIGAAASVMARGIDVENCGCTSVSATGSGSSVGLVLIARNLLLLGSALVVAFVTPRTGERTAEAPALAAPR